MNRKISYIIEIIWLVIGIFCLLLGFRKTIQYGFSNSYVFYILAVLAFLMYSLRNYLRKSQKNK
jgi:type IV secretory pathway TrbL component